MVDFKKNFRKDFDIWPQQAEVLDWFAEIETFADEPMVIALAAPTATGKTVLAETYAKTVWKEKRWRSAYTTPSNQLLDQADKDFKTWPVLKGAVHYQCMLYKNKTVAAIKDNPIAKTICTECRKENKDEYGYPLCPYFKARQECAEAKHSIFNVMSYLYFKKTPDMYFDVLIVDEFHTLPDFFKAMYDITFWHKDTNYERGVSASIPALMRFLEARTFTIKKLLTNPNIHQKTVEMLIAEHKKINVVQVALTEDPGNFVIEETKEWRFDREDECLKVRAVYCPKRVVKRFTQFAKRVILMSGTTFAMDLDELGFNKYKFKEVASPIPVENRRIIIDCVASFIYKDREKLAPVMAEKIMRTVEENHKTERGVILVTYAQALLLKQYLTDPVYKFHDKKNKSQVINDFMNNTHERQIAVLSGSWEGLDLKYEIANFVMIGALPLPNWGDAVVKRRTQLDSIRPNPYFWYDMQAMKNVIQGAGRASRTTTDKSTIYIFDSKFTKSFMKVKGKLPKYFLEAIVWVKA